jgi:hypothetical protein
MMGECMAAGVSGRGFVNVIEELFLRSYGPEKDESLPDEAESDSPADRHGVHDPDAAFLEGANGRPFMLGEGLGLTKVQAIEKQPREGNAEVAFEIEDRLVRGLTVDGDGFAVAMFGKNGSGGGLHEVGEDFETGVPKPLAVVRSNPNIVAHRCSGLMYE